MRKPPAAPSTYATLHIAVVPRPDGSFAVSAVQRRWRNGAKDSARVVHRGTVTPQAHSHSVDENLWVVGQYFQLLAARGVVTSLGAEATEEPPREPRGAVGGGQGTQRNP